MSTIPNKDIKLSQSLQLLQDRLTGKRIEPLNNIELKRIFESHITPEFNLILVESLKKRLITADDALTHLIPKITGDEYMIPFSICIRYGANVNMYIKEPEIGVIHLLAYIYYHLNYKYDKVAAALTFLLLLRGTNFTLPVFDKSGGKIKKYTDEIEFKSVTVRDWIITQGYKTPLTSLTAPNMKNVSDMIEKETLNNFSILLDDITISNGEFKKEDMKTVIRSFSVDMLDKIPESKISIILDNKNLRDSVIYLNYDSFQYFIKKGYYPSYILITKIIVNMSHYNQNKNIFCQNVLEKMLLLSVSYGCELDSEQYNMISFLGKDLLENLNNEYNKPYWIKTCKSTFENIDDNVKPSEKLKKLASSLNIQNSLNKKGICNQISKLSKADKELLKESAIRRQKNRMAMQVNSITEFYDDKVNFNPVCANRSLLQNDPFEYSDLSIAFYIDDQNNDWCFTSDMFEKILETGKNPYTALPITEEFKKKLQNQTDLLKELDLLETPMLFTDAVEKLNINDTISNESSLKQINLLKKIGLKYKVSPDVFDTVTKEKLENALSQLGISPTVLEFQYITRFQALIITSYIINSKYERKEDVTSFFRPLMNY